MLIETALTIGYHLIKGFRSGGLYERFLQIQ